MNPLDALFNEWLEQRDLGKSLTESLQSNRYSVEINYRTKMEEVIDGYAKIALGYVSAGMKNCGYHCKTMFTNKPYRVMVSSRNWDDGEWVGLAVFNHEGNRFDIARGSYNKDLKTVTIQSSRKSSGVSAADIVRELRNVMEELKRTPPRGSNTLNPADLKRGPKPTHLKKLNTVSGPWKPKFK